MLIYVAIVLFILAAVFGLINLVAILRDQPTPKPAVYIHGLLAATALTLLIIDIIKGHKESLLIASAIIFIVAAMGGFILFVLDMERKKIPKILALLHPLIAVSGLAVLVVYALQ